MKTISVLLVDDDRILLDNLASICDWEALGFHIAGKAMNGVQAGNMYKKLRPDLVISDIVMPALDGIGLLKQIMEQDPSAWVILLSSYEDFDYAKQGILYGARDYMLKNEITPETITEKLLLIRSRIAKQQQETALFRANALADLFRHQHNTSTADMLSSTALRSFVYQSFGYVILDIPTRLNAPEEETGPVWDLAKTLSERFPEETAAAIADHQILLLTDPAADASHLERYDRLRRFCEELRQTDCLPAGTVFLLSTTPRDLVDFYRLYTAHMLRKRHFARMDPDTPVRQIEDLHLPDELPAFSFDRKIFRPFEKTGDPEALEAVLQDLQERSPRQKGWTALKNAPPSCSAASATAFTSRPISARSFLRLIPIGITLPHCRSSAGTHSPARRSRSVPARRPYSGPWNMWKHIMPNRICPLRRSLKASVSPPII